VSGSCKPYHDIIDGHDHPAVHSQCQRQCTSLAAGYAQLVPAAQTRNNALPSIAIRTASEVASLSAYGVMPVVCGVAACLEAGWIAQGALAAAAACR
jgi:hypothetical protein